MSIALSATVRVSPALRCAQAALCAALLAAATMVADAAASALLLAGGVLGAGCCRAAVKAARIDISGGGGIRLTVYQQVEPARGTHDDAAPHAGWAVQVMPGSTLWPGSLFLRLRETAPPQGAPPRTWWLAVLPDSAAPDVRRRLAVAMRAIAARAG